MAVIYTKKQKRSIIIRVCLLVVLLIVIVVCIVNVINSMKTKDGYTEITADYATVTEASGSYSLYYYVETTENSAAYNEAHIKYLYSELTDKAYSLLSSQTSYEDTKNIYYINNHPNEIIEIDSFLYDSLKKINSLDSSILLMGGIYQYWSSIFYNLADSNSKNDPLNNEEDMNYISSYMANYQDFISIDFLDNNQIRLNVSTDDYIYITDEDDFYTEYISTNIYFDSLIMDYVKSGFNANGYYNGYISSNTGLLLDFGTDEDLLQSFNLLFYRYGQVSSYGSVNIKSNYAYANAYSFPIVSDYYEYPYYSFTKDDKTIRRDLFISLDDGYTNASNMAYLTYDNKSLTEVLYDMYNLKINNTFGNNYLILSDDYKVKTNIVDITLGDLVEVEDE